MKKLLALTVVCTTALINAAHPTDHRASNHAKETHFSNANPFTDEEACQLKKLYAELRKAAGHSTEPSRLSSYLAAIDIFGLTEPHSTLVHLDANRINASINNVHPNKGESTSTAIYLQDVLMIREPERITSDPEQLRILRALKQETDPALLTKTEEAVRTINSNILIDPEHMPTPTLAQVYFLLHGRTVEVATLDKKTVAELEALREEIITCGTNPYIAGAPDVAHKPNCKKIYKLLKANKARLNEHRELHYKEADSIEREGKKEADRIRNEELKQRATQADALIKETKVKADNAIKGIQDNLEALKIEARQEIERQRAARDAEIARLVREINGETAAISTDAEKLALQKEKEAQQEAETLRNKACIQNPYMQDMDRIAQRIKEVQNLSDDHKTEPHSV